MTHLDEYRLLLAEIDCWFNHCQQQHPEEIACAKGCSECCRGLFDITILDAALLKTGFDKFSEDTRKRIRVKAEERLTFIQSLWPEFGQPFTLNHRPEQEIEELLAADNETPCILLDDAGRCLLYDFRPMTCRLHGLPLIDVSGDVMEREWCPKNFTGCDPFEVVNLRGGFDRLFRNEAALGRDFTLKLLGEAVCELDTVIPTALLLDFQDFDWPRWFTGKHLKT